MERDRYRKKYCSLFIQKALGIGHNIYCGHTKYFLKLKVKTNYIWIENECETLF